MAEEKLDVVNEKDEIIGIEFKSKKAEKGFISRNIAVFLMDSNGKIMLCKRSPNKKVDPDLWDLAVCGSVTSGENYEQAAIREIKEEVDISCDLKYLDRYYQEINYGNKTDKYFSTVFLGITDKSPQLNHELVEVKKMRFDEVEMEIKTNPNIFCQGFINDFNKVKKKLRSVSVSLHDGHN